MEIKLENKPMSFDEVLQTPELSELHEVIRYLQKTPNKDIFPKKYEMSMEDATIREVGRVFQDNPYCALKIVIMTVLEKLPDDLSAILILKMTKLIIQEWGTLSKATVIEERVLQAA
jgi:hypothetical protein